MLKLHNKLTLPSEFKRYKGLVSLQEFEIGFDLYWSDTPICSKLFKAGTGNNYAKFCKSKAFEFTFKIFERIYL